MLSHVLMKTVVHQILIFAWYFLASVVGSEGTDGTDESIPLRSNIWSVGGNPAMELSKRAVCFWLSKRIGIGAKGICPVLI